MKNNKIEIGMIISTMIGIAITVAVYVIFIGAGLWLVDSCYPNLYAAIARNGSGNIDGMTNILVIILKVISTGIMFYYASKALHYISKGLNALVKVVSKSKKKRG